MIYLGNKEVEAQEAQAFMEEQDHLNVREEQDPPNREPPPTYASLQPSPGHSVAKTVNYVSISRLHSSITETLIIDPSRFVSPILRPPLLPGETEATRQNLRLESTHGNVVADVTLVSQNSSDTQRVTMNIKSTHGLITAKIHGPPDRTPFVLRAQSLNGNIGLHVPRTFQGPITISYQHGSLRFSEGVSQNLTTFGEVDNTRQCFLGDFSGWDESCRGDELVIDVQHGNVKIHYDDDAVGSPVKTRPTFLNRIFGF